MAARRRVLLLIGAALLAAGLAVATLPRGSVVSLPRGAPGIGFDDLRFSARLRRLLVPGGRTGSLFLLDPGTRAVAVVPGFTSRASFPGGHDVSVTSADEGEGLVFATDRTSQTVVVIDPARLAIVARTPLGASPDYVRWCSPNREIWVTEPDSDRIETFSLRIGAHPTLVPNGEIPVPGGPESLVVDEVRNRAYTHLWAGQTVAIDLASRAVRETWKNGCSGSRGIALDSKRGLLFVGCAEGRATVLDVAHGGRLLGSEPVGEGVDVIDYDPRLSHLYVPSGKTATLSILAVSAKGELRTLGSFGTAPGAHCAVTDGLGWVYACDPRKGQLLVIRDAFSPSDH